MQYGQQQFKKYLINEIKKKSNQSYGEIYKEITIYSKTKDFENKYRKWRAVFSSKEKNYDRGPLHISEILGAIKK